MKRRWDAAGSRGCARARGVFSSRIFQMVDTTRQVHAPSAQAWSVDLTSVGGPTFTVLRTLAVEAREAVVAYLMDIGSGLTQAAATEVVMRATVTEVSVVW